MRSAIIIGHRNRGLGRGWLGLLTLRVGMHAGRRLIYRLFGCATRTTAAIPKSQTSARLPNAQGCSAFFVLEVRPIRVPPRNSRENKLGGCLSPPSAQAILRRFPTPDTLPSHCAVVADRARRLVFATPGASSLLTTRRAQSPTLHVKNLIMVIEPRSLSLGTTYPPWATPYALIQGSHPLVVEHSA